MKIFINNKFYQPNKANINVMDAGFNFGLGAFETIRTYNHKPFKLNEHINRLWNSLRILNIKSKYSKKYINESVESFIQKNEINKTQEFRIKIIVTKKYLIISGLILKLEKQKKYKLKIFTIERFLPEAKSLNYLLSIYLHDLAIKNKCDEALLVDRDDYVREGAFSNIFIIKNRVIYTPINNILKGITRQVVIDLAMQNNYNVVEKDFKIKYLQKADEVFITKTTTGITIVKNGKITRNLIRKFNEYTKTN